MMLLQKFKRCGLNGKWFNGSNKGVKKGRHYSVSNTGNTISGFIKICKELK
jgi:hypothetical protein